MNKKRKKTKLPLDYQVESFFKKVLYLHDELTKNENKGEGEHLNIEKLDLKALVYNGMEQYEDLMSIFKIKSLEKEKLRNIKKIHNKEKNVGFDKKSKKDNHYYKNDDDYDEYSLNKKRSFNLKDNKNIKKKVRFNDKNMIIIIIIKIL